MRIASFTLASVLLLGGCAQTTLKSPLFEYGSTKDIYFDSVDITVVEEGEGPTWKKTTEIHVRGGKGQASSVIDAQAVLLGAAIRAGVDAALKGAVPGG